jgi:hypothetical protein
MCQNNQESFQQALENAGKEFQAHPSDAASLKCKVPWQMARDITRCSEHLNIADDSAHYDKKGIERALAFMELYEDGAYTLKFISIMVLDCEIMEIGIMFDEFLNCTFTIRAWTH